MQYPWTAKLLSAAVASLFVIGFIKAQVPPPSAAPEALRWTQRSAEVTLGVTDRQAAAHYTFQNVSDKPVTVFGVATSCKCLSAAADKKVYAPQEKGEVTITFKPLPNQAATTAGSAIVQTDAARHPNVELKLTASMTPAASGQLEPEMLAWPDGEALQPKTIRLTFPEGSPVKEVSVTSTDAKVAGAQVKAIRAGREYQVAVTPVAEVKTALEAKLIIKAQYPSGRSSVLIALVRLR